MIHKMQLVSVAFGDENSIKSAYIAGRWDFCNTFMWTGQVSMESFC